MLWSFWIACGLSVTGGIAPLLLAAGGPNRIAGVVIPFGVAAVAMGLNALMHHQGRPLATGLYFIGSIALVYGMLSMVAVPLRLAVLGTCSSTAALACPPGSELPLSTGENSGLAIGIAMGTIAILVGFFGLLMLFRIKPQIATPPPTRRQESATPPPTRREKEAPVVTPPQAPVAAMPITPAAEEPEANAPAAPEPEPTFSAPSPNPAVPAPTPKPPRKPRTKRVPKPQAELPAPEAPLELSAPEEPLEPPALSSPDKPPSSTS